MNHKAQFEIRKTLYWTVSMTIITLVIFAIAFQMISFQKNITKTPAHMQAEFIVLRFINSPDCFTYQSGDRTYPGIIDFQKFNEKTLRTCYPVNSKKEINFGLKLKSQSNEIITKKYYPNNRDFTLYKQVLVKKGDKITPDLLEIGVQVKT